MRDLVESIDLGNRLVSNVFDINFESVDFSMIKELLNKKIDESKAYIDNAIYGSR